MVRLALIAVLGACTAKQEATRPRSADVPFARLDHDQRIRFMEDVVLPAMEPMFQKHDPAKYADFGCVTCHGKLALDGDYRMPNRELPTLDFNDLSKFKSEDLAWMREVKPAMARLLRRPVWAEDNPTGFGCEGCHPTVE